jgi:hypothetical protein
VDPFEERFKAQFGDMMLRAMKNKPEILATLTQHLMFANKTNQGLENFEAFCRKVEDGDEDSFTPKAAAQMIRVLAATCRKQAEALTHLGCFALVYGLGDTFDGDAAKAAMRFGKGQEALQAMLQAKFGDKNPFKGGR